MPVTTLDTKAAPIIVDLQKGIASFPTALGFNVTLAIDSMSDLNAHAHANSLAQIFPRLGETGSSQEIIDLLAIRSV